MLELNPVEVLRNRLINPTKRACGWRVNYACDEDLMNESVGRRVRHRCSGISEQRSGRGEKGELGSMSRGML